MKTITIAAVVGSLVIGALYFYQPTTSEYVRESSEEEITAVEVVEVDVIDSAKAELERINQELDAEEARLKAEIAERQLRIERIKETRQGF